MTPDNLKNFLWIQYLRVALASTIVLAMMLAGFMGRSPWLVLVVTPLFTALYALGKWAVWTNAWHAGGARKIAVGVLVTLPIQAIVAGVFYLIGLGVGRLLPDAAPIAALSLQDLAVALIAFLVCVAACVMIIRGEAALRRLASTTAAATAAADNLLSVTNAANATNATNATNTLAPIVDVRKNEEMKTKADQTTLDSSVDGRIYFPGNPWPLGHRVVSCTFNASVCPAVGEYTEGYPNPGPGLMLELELTTADYDEEDATDRDAEGDSDWTSKIVWNNYHSCTLGPSHSSQVQGIRVSDGTTPFVFDLPEYRFKVDPLPVDWTTFSQTSAFRTYLLGHDTVADHDIALHSRQPDGSYTLDWTGKIALTYFGDDEFKYDFHARVTGVKFNEITLFYFDAERAKEYYDIDLDPKLSARDYLAPFVADPDNFNFETRVDGIKRAVVYAKRNAITDPI
jgi:hypothetical protein